MKILKRQRHHNLKDYLICMLDSICGLIESIIELVTLGTYTTELYDYVTFELFED